MVGKKIVSMGTFRIATPRCLPLRAKTMSIGIALTQMLTEEERPQCKVDAATDGIAVAKLGPVWHTFATRLEEEPVI